MKLNELNESKNFLKVIHDCLCFGSWGFGSQRLGFNIISEYDIARSHVVNEKGEGSVCIEDVYVKGLELGMNLKMTDKVDQDIKVFNIYTMRDNLGNVDLSGICKLLSGDYDIEDSDYILQELIWGEVVFS
tara:strand:- start:275 stop:667 length:393 start_codon:yes stop_codon:yes gene_type:complete